MVAKNIAHFGVYADDVERAKRFYGRVFGWRFSQWGPPDFFMVATGEEADPGIHGAVHERPKNEDRSVAFQFTISVDDVDAVAKLGEAEGGKIKVLR
jgi:predicted enzyme related to lactoylglutathione lyase